MTEPPLSKSSAPKRALLSALGRAATRNPVFITVPELIKPPSMSPVTSKALEFSPITIMGPEFVTSPPTSPATRMAALSLPAKVKEPSLSRLPVKPACIIAVLSRLIPKLSFPSTTIVDPAWSSTLPSKGEAPEIRIPVRPVPWAKGPSGMPSSSMSVGIKLSPIPLK